MKYVILKENLFGKVFFWNVKIKNVERVKLVYLFNIFLVKVIYWEVGKWLKCKRWVYFWFVLVMGKSKIFILEIYIFSFKYFSLVSV